jgi:hypothetical protein
MSGLELQFIDGIEVFRCQAFGICLGQVPDIWHRSARYKRLSWILTCTNQFGAEYVARVVANSFRRTLPAVVNGREAFFREMNAGILEII